MRFPGEIIWLILWAVCVSEEIVVWCLPLWCDLKLCIDPIAFHILSSSKI
ncbi:unnamed protein product [Gulo gulo]|uniref:Uncharacterized protein n=1 Tax=Gulo gulo TaxID=48420 RepID=A0A9X9PWW5_GULGU|nr:unnamed protein product [Gulo gulo]